NGLVKQMRIGYACINMSIGCSSARTFRLKSYTEPRLIATIQENLQCLRRIIRFNLENNILFFRITSDLIPFASHPIMKVDWKSLFSDELSEIGELAVSAGMRLSMHPGQYTVLNSTSDSVYRNALADLQYHCDILDLMNLGPDAKVQIHIGGVYGDKEASLQRFAERYDLLDKTISRRLVVENDDHSYTQKDCMFLSELTGIPVVFDNLHHDVLNHGESIRDSLKRSAATWTKREGPPIVHYSSQSPTGRPGKHAATLDTNDFADFLQRTRDIGYDLMIEIKDKDISALKALRILDRIHA
ncbi:MAG: UV DNA damage repair endonuclease UvsE, partial [Promethearchaeota archaeon]